MGTIARGKDWVDGEKLYQADLDGEFDTIYNEFNGNIENANIKATAAIAGSKLDLTSGTGAITSTGAVSLTGAVGITGALTVSTTLGVTGVATFTATPKTDAIAEKTTATGVTVDGVVLKDGTLQKRVTTVASSATPTPSADTTDIYTITALAEAAAFGAVTGTPVNGQTLLIRIKDNASARALTWNAIYRASTDLALPTTTVISKTMYVGFIYNSTDTKWDLLAVVDGF